MLWLFFKMLFGFGEGGGDGMDGRGVPHGAWRGGIRCFRMTW